jgi:hypothetical protein
MLHETFVTSFDTVVLHQPGGIDAYSGSGGTAPLILNFGTRLRLEVNMPGPLNPPPPGKLWSRGCLNILDEINRCLFPDLSPGPSTHSPDTTAPALGHPDFHLFRKCPLFVRTAVPVPECKYLARCTLLPSCNFTTQLSELLKTTPRFYCNAEEC